MRPRPSIGVLVFALAFAHAAHAVAPPDAPPEAPPDAPPAADQPPPPDGDAPEYPSGRIPRFSPRNELLLVPRLVLRLPRELFRRVSLPFQGMMILNERYQIYAHVIDALTSADGRIGVRLAFDFANDYQPLYGFSFFDERIAGPGTALYAKLEAGGGKLVVADVEARPIVARGRFRLVAGARYFLRDDQVFRAIPSLSPWDPGRSRFLLNAFDLTLEPRLWLTRTTWLSFGAELGVRRYGDGREGGDPPISELYCVRALGRCIPGTVDERLVPGFRDGTEFLRGGAAVHYDGFNHPARPTAGAHVDLAAQYTHGLADRGSWFTLFGSVGVAVNVWQRSHVLLLRADAALVVPTSDAPVPFTELAMLGGADSLRGVLPGRFRDFSTLLVSAEYRWPIWMWADAAVFADWGGAAGQLYAGLDARKFVPAVGGAIRIRTSEHVYLRGQLAWGWPDGLQSFLTLGGGF